MGKVSSFILCLVVIGYCSVDNEKNKELKNTRNQLAYEYNMKSNKLNSQLMYEYNLKENISNSKLLYEYK